MKRCKRCILPEGFPGIHFNDEGICNFCLDYKPPSKPLGKDKLIEVIDSVRKKAKKGKYDCVVPLSGGKDSTYVLYYAVKELGLKPIAASYDSGFLALMAKENMKRTCEILNVPHVLVKTNMNVQKKVMREAFLISEIAGSFVRTCGNCESMLRSVPLNVARKYNVPIVLWGSSLFESSDVASYKKVRFGSSFFEAVREKLSKLFKLEYKKLIKLAPRLIKHSLLSTYQKIIMGVPLKYALHPVKTIPFYDENPKFIHFFDYIEWDSINDIKVLKEDLQWKHPKEKESRFDCRLKCFGNHNYLQSKRISSCGNNYCNFIRENKISRDAALTTEEYLINSVSQQCREIIDEIGLTKYEVPELKDLD